MYFTNKFNLNSRDIKYYEVKCLKNNYKYSIL